MRLITWIPITVLALLALVAWTAMRAEHPLALAFDEPPTAGSVAQPTAPRGTATLIGRLANEAGRPVREALVEMHQGTRLRWTHSDTEGSFRISGVEPGEHEITVVARGFPPLVVSVQAGDSENAIVLDRRTPSSPTVPAAERSTLLARLRPAGTETDLSRFELRLEPLERDVRAGPSFPRRAAFQDDGSCAIEEVTHGRYRAHVLPRWAVGGSWPDLLTELDGPGIVLNHPSAEPWELELKSGEIRGRVTDNLGGRDRRVEYLAGALVLVRPLASGPDEDPRIWPPAESDERGAFLIRDLPPGRYEVTIHAGDQELVQAVNVYPAATTTLEN